MKYIIENRSELPDSEAMEIVGDIVSVSYGSYSGVYVRVAVSGKRFAVSYDKNKASHRFVVFDYRSEK